MSPEELAHIYPTLFHVTEPDAWPKIQKHGLLSTLAILDLFEVDHATRVAVTEQCRPTQIPLKHPQHGSIVINDNKPMSEQALLKCLDDGLAPKDWLRMLNSRVFFWCSDEGLSRLLGAKMNKGRKRLVLVIDTLSFSKEHTDYIEICPINSGSTIRKPARRGLKTFTPLGALPYKDWQKKRGRRDKILEVTCLRGVPDICNFVRDRYIA
ncbi:MAG: hypothetical protein AAF909_11190 [Pseudomonadota bacterium]